MLHFLEWINIISTLNKPLGSNQSGVRIGFKLDATIQNVATNSKSKTSLNVTRTHDSLNCLSACRQCKDTISAVARAAKKVGLKVDLNISEVLFTFLNPVYAHLTVCLTTRCGDRKVDNFRFLGIISNSKIAVQTVWPKSLQYSVDL